MHRWRRRSDDCLSARKGWWNQVYPACASVDPSSGSRTEWKERTETENGTRDGALQMIGSDQRTANLRLSRWFSAGGRGHVPNRVPPSSGLTRYSLALPTTYKIHILLVYLIHILPSTSHTYSLTYNQTHPTFLHQLHGVPASPILVIVRMIN